MIKVRETVWGKLIMQTVQNTMDNGFEIKNRVMESLSVPLGINSGVTGNKACEMDKA